MVWMGFTKNGIRIKPNQVWTVGSKTIDGGGQVKIIRTTGGDGLITVVDASNGQLIYVKSQNLGKLISE